MKFIDVHTHTSTQNTEVTSIENKYPNSSEFNNLFSIGIHPWHLSKEKLYKELSFIKEQLNNPNCLAIGECGLDKLIETDLEFQIQVFKEHIKLSEEFNKPIIIHCVRAYQEIIQLKKELKPTQKWILHGFNKNFQIAQNLTKHNVYLSFGKSLLENDKLQETFSKIPIKKIFLETDDKSVDIKDIYKKASEIKEIEDLKEIINQNFKKVFTK